MTARVAALVRNFLQTDGDALYLVAGEKIFITRGTTRTVAGREIVSEDAFRAVVEELVPGVSAEVLAQNRSCLPYAAEEGLAPVEIHFSTVGGTPALMVVRTGKGPRNETPGPAGPPPPETGPGPAPLGVSAALSQAAVLDGSLDVSAGGGSDVPTPPPSSVRRRPDGLETLLRRAREKGASDLFFSPGERPWFRIHGSVVVLGTASPGPGEIEEFLAGRATSRVSRSVSAAGNARFVLEIEGAGRCLVRASRDRSGTGLAIRLLPAEAPQLGTLGLPQAVSRLAGPAPGLLLVAGPPGSGRSTALAALAAHAAQGRAERVVTVEDPVEILIPPGRGSVSQRESGVDVPSVRAGLRVAATEDADVVLVGAVPDAASAALLVELAASGRLVLAAAPAPSLALALQWLEALLPEGRRVGLRSLLAATFRGGLALALCRGRKGGRAAAAESLHPGSLVSELILDGGLAGLPEYLKDSPGYVSLNSSLAGLVGAGLVDSREALLRSLDRPALLARLREEGAALSPVFQGGSPGSGQEP